MVPRVMVHRITHPVVFRVFSLHCSQTTLVEVHAYNIRDIQVRLQRGEVLYIQRAGTNHHQRMRSINHLAIQNLIIASGDSILRHGTKYPVKSGGPHPPVYPQDVLLPVQSPECASGGRYPPLCFGDRVRRPSTNLLLDPLSCITWPELYIGDCVLIVPTDGDIVLVNRQPTLVQPRDMVWCYTHHIPTKESMLAMHIRVGPQLSFAASCAPIEALRGDQGWRQKKS